MMGTDPQDATSSALLAVALRSGLPPDDLMRAVLMLVYDLARTFSETPSTHLTGFASNCIILAAEDMRERRAIAQGLTDGE